MTAWKKILAWGSMLAGGAVLIALGVFFAVAGLDQAALWAEVIGVFAALLGLGLSAYAVVLARGGPAGHAGQAVSGSTIGGGIVQVEGVRGNLHLGAPPASPPASPPPSSASPAIAAEPGHQSVTGTCTGGPVRQIRDIGGDADIDQ